MRRTIALMSLMAFVAVPLSGCAWHHDDERSAYAPPPAYQGPYEQGYQGPYEQGYQRPYDRDMTAPPQQRSPEGVQHDEDDYYHR